MIIEPTQRPRALDCPEPVAQCRYVARRQPERAGDLVAADRLRLVAQKLDQGGGGRERAAAARGAGARHGGSAGRGTGLLACRLALLGRSSAGALGGLAGLRRLRGLCRRLRSFRRLRGSRSAGRFGGGLARLAAALSLVALRRDQGNRLVERQRVGIGAARQRSDDPVVADIGAVAAAVEADRAAIGMSADLAHELRPAPLPAGRLRQQRDGAVEADGQDIVIGRKRFEDPSVLEVGAEAADAGEDRFAGFGVAPDFARQREQLQRRREIDIGGFQRARQRHALRLRAVVAFAELDVIAVRALLEADRLAGGGIVAEAGVGGSGGFALALNPERSGVAAIRVVGAADERAETAELEAQAPGAAGRAQARVAAGAVVWEEVAAKILVERRQHLAYRQILGAVHGGGEIAPEAAQHFLPVDAAIGDLVELVFQIGREIVFDVAVEEAGQKGGDQPAAVLGNEATLLKPHILPVLQHLQDRGVSRGPADAQFLEPFDKARLGIARRRLGEVLARRDRPALQPLALAHGRQAPPFPLLFAN